jgi:hypothetical protein
VIKGRIQAVSLEMPDKRAFASKLPLVSFKGPLHPPDSNNNITVEVITSHNIVDLCPRHKYLFFYFVQFHNWLIAIIYCAEHFMSFSKLTERAASKIEILDVLVVMPFQKYNIF